MNRNNEVFATLPQLTDVQRSKFSRNSGVHTSFMSGKLIPFYLDEVLPGDTFDVRLSATVRMSTPIVPVMDDCFLDTYFFYVPNRLCWNRWKEFCGENARSNYNTPFDDIDIQIPKIAFNKESSQPKNENGLFLSHPDNAKHNSTLERSLVDYFGLPYLNFEDKRKGTDDYENTVTFNMLPFEAYNLIWNNFFRDKNYSDECPLLLQETSANDIEAIRGHVYMETNEHFKSFYGDAVPSVEYLSVKPVSKFHDYFTSMLPNAQRGAPVILPGFNEEDRIAVTTGKTIYQPTGLNNDALRMGTSDGQPYTSASALSIDQWGLTYASQETAGGGKAYVQPLNLWTNPGVPGSILPTINDLRNAFAIQRLLEKDALGGNLYSELIYSHFGVSNPDARVQLPEYLGGDRVSISMEQVVQTSETNVTPQGNVSGLSLTNSVGSNFVKSFTEHGYIIGVCCVRPMHSYQNGIEKLWQRNERFDFYYPALANIGEQPVMCSELVAKSKADDYPIGYQEAWAEYRYKPSLITSTMRTGLDDSLDIWHYADAFGVPNGNSFDAFDEYFIYEDVELIDRTLAVSSRLEPQFFGDFYIQCDAIRPMPLYSIPGLVDHH